MPALLWSDGRLTIATVLAALPCGYGFGVVAAFLLAGAFGIAQAWLVTVPLSLLAAIALAFLPLVAAETRFMIVGVGATVAIDLHLMVGLLAAH
jgi:pantoate kinase